MNAEERIRTLQRELLALKRGMFGGARSYFNTTVSTHTFTGTTSSDMIIHLEFENADFPMLYASASISGSGSLPMGSVQRVDKYNWVVFTGGRGSVNYTIECYCFAEQVPAVWSIS